MMMNESDDNEVPGSWPRASLEEQLITKLASPLTPNADSTIECVEPPLLVAEASQIAVCPADVVVNPMVPVASTGVGVGVGGQSVQVLHKGNNVHLVAQSCSFVEHQSAQVPVVHSVHCWQPSHPHLVIHACSCPVHQASHVPDVH